MTLRSARRFLLVAWVTYAGVGIAWMGMNLGDVPPYGDTKKYLKYARAQDDGGGYRGILYPVALRWANQWQDAPGFLVDPGRWRDGAAYEPLRRLASVQLMQSALSLLCLAYFLHVVLNPRARPSTEGRKESALGFCLLLALIFLDPIVSHFNLAIMTDGPALSASLAFCAAFADFGCRRSSRWVSGSILLAAYLLSATLRVERNWVLLGTAILTLTGWGLMHWQTGGRRLPGTTLIMLGGLVLAGFGSAFALQPAIEPDADHWPLRTTVLHQRIAFPHVASAHESLPLRSRKLLSRTEAELCDEHITRCRRVLGKAAGDELPRLQSLVDDIAETVWRDRWAEILLDTVADTLQNLLATPVFYAHSAVAALGGSRAPSWLHDHRTENNQRIFFRMSKHHPVLSAVYLGLAAMALVVGGVLALLRMSHWLGEPRSETNFDGLVVWTPILAFCLVNAVVFAVSQNLVQIRYTLAAHVVGLLIVYRAALSWFRQSGGPVSFESRQRADLSAGRTWGQSTQRRPD